MSQLLPNVFVQPAYGQDACLLNWTQPPGWEEADWYVYQSDNGTTGWVCVNPDTPVRYQTSFEVSGIQGLVKLTQYHFRVVAERVTPAGVVERIKSPTATAYATLSRGQYAAVRKAMRDWVKQLRRADGIQVFHFIPLTRGEPNPRFDPDSQQAIGACADDTGYGLPYVGGYGAPRQTWIALDRRSPEMQKSNPDGTGGQVEVAVQATMLAFPQPLRGHLLVHPPTDDRYVVAEMVEVFRFRGIVPIRYQVTLQLLRRNDARYRVPVPPLQADPAHE